VKTNIVMLATSLQVFPCFLTREQRFMTNE